MLTQEVRPIADILRPLLIGGQFTAEDSESDNSSVVSSGPDDGRHRGMVGRGRTGGK